MTLDNLPLAWDSLGRPHLETFHQSCACEIGSQSRRNKNAFQSLSALRKALPVSVGRILVSMNADTTGRLTPLTFVSHFAPSPAEQQLSYRLGSSAKSTRAPAVVCVSPSQTVRELKAAVLRADGRSVRDDLLDHVILWRVDMSQEEMIVIGERGGLKNGRMPWP